MAFFELKKGNRYLLFEQDASPLFFINLSELLRSNDHPI